MKRAIRIGLFALMAMVMLFPTWLMMANSLSPAKAFLRNPPRLLPHVFTLENYKRALTLRGVGQGSSLGYPLLPRWILNTLLLASVLIVGGVLINGAAGYAFCFARPRWMRALFWVMLSPVFVTRYVLLISQFIIVGKLGLSGLAAVVSMSLYWATGIYLFRNYFKSIPASIIESARIDGASEWRILTQIVLPLAKPILGAAVVFLGMGALGDYIWQMLNLQTVGAQTYLVGLMATTINVYAVKNIGYDLTVGTLLFLPYLALFSFSSRYFIGGLTGGAIRE
jgi:ABC-type glycerol-3-phosphate transport system permease component